MYNSGEMVMTDIKALLDSLSNEKAIECLTKLHTESAISDDEYIEMLNVLLLRTECKLKEME